MIYVRDGIPYRHRLDLGGNYSESCVIEVCRPKCKKLYVWLIYRAPDVQLQVFVDELNSSLIDLVDSAECVLLGDFNVNFMDSKSAAKRKILTRMANENNLDQLIKQPTRITETSSSLIDLLFSNSCQRVVDHGVIHLALSDHSLIFCVLKAGCPKAPGKTIQYRSYKHYSKSEFVKDLEDIDWNLIDNESDINAAVSVWNKFLTETADRHAPLKTTRLKGVRQTWMTSKLSEAMQRRDYLHRKAVKSNYEQHWVLYRNQKNFVNREIRKCKSEYYCKLVDENKKNPTALWKTLNEITSRKQSSQISCIESDGVIYSDAKSLATILNKHFATIGVKLANKLKSIARLTASVISSTPTPSSKFTFSPITNEFVLNQLKILKTNKATGLDRISARLLKDSANVITDSLTKLFNRSLSTSTFPLIWKCARVTSLFKKSDRCDPNNYRPISVLPTISKLLEKAVHTQLYGYLNEHNLITPKQFGFRPRLSTGIALADFTDNILSSMDNGRITGAVFLDLSKAFDTVNHALLISKLELLGVDKNSIGWFKSYLSDRSQSTVVGDVISAALPMTVGVPQGSILGPLFFVVYVNDLPSCNLNSNITLYADDTVLYYSSKNADDIESKLNSDLSTVSTWFHDNLLSLNTSKCKFVVFGSSQKLKNIRALNLYVNSNPLDNVDSFKYLGVTLQRNMSWSDHIDATCTKIKQRLGILRRVKLFLPLHGRITLYNSLISPLFDYADFVWGDKNNATQMEQLQVLQNKAAKTILDNPIWSSATAALHKLNWVTLDKRRLFNRVTMAYKYLDGQLDFDFNIKLNSDMHTHDTRQKNDIRMPLAKRNWGQQRFIYSIFSDWNKLDPNYRNINSLHTFKAEVKKDLFM